MKTLEERLDEVQQAISEILSGAQEASYNGQRVRKADLQTLLQAEKHYENAIKNKRRTIRIRGVTPV